jgi:hypothetical protein
MNVAVWHSRCRRIAPRSALLRGTRVSHRCTLPPCRITPYAVMRSWCEVEIEKNPRIPDSWFSALRLGPRTSPSGTAGADRSRHALPCYVAHAYHTAALARPVASHHTQSSTGVARLKLQKNPEFRIFGFPGSDSAPERRRLAQRVPADRATPYPVAWHTRIIPLHSPGLLHHAIRTHALVWQG